MPPNSRRRYRPRDPNTVQAIPFGRGDQGVARIHANAAALSSALIRGATGLGGGSVHDTLGGFFPLSSGRIVKAYRSSTKGTAMNRSGIGLAVTSLVLTAGVGLTACSQPAPAPTPGRSADPASSPTHDAPAAAVPIAAAAAQQAARPDPARSDSSLADGRHPARITAVDPSGEQVTIDVVQFFQGDAAADAARADGSLDVPPPNDYWIRNVNPSLRTLPVAADASVTVNILSSDETGDSQTNSTISLSKLGSYGDVQGSLFWVTTRGGAVTGIAEQWMP